MWRPTMLLLCLIAALAGTPLRQAEAAGDLARSLAELEGGGVVEEIDGGVGDDAGETIVRAGDDSGSSQAGAASAAVDGPRTTLHSIGWASSAGDPRQPAGQEAGPAPARSVRWHAWLQRFLF
jgi:hypothetical protein